MVVHQIKVKSRKLPSDVNKQEEFEKEFPTLPAYMETFPEPIPDDFLESMKFAEHMKSMKGKPNLN